MAGRPKLVEHRTSTIRLRATEDERAQLAAAAKAAGIPLARWAREALLTIARQDSTMTATFEITAASPDQVTVECDRLDILIRLDPHTGCWDSGIEYVELLHDDGSDLAVWALESSTVGATAELRVTK